MIQNILDTLGNVIGTLELSDETPSATVQQILNLYSNPIQYSDIKLLTSYQATATGAVTTSSTAASVVTSMSLVPTQGQYLIFFSGDISTNGTNAAGQFGIYKDAILFSETQRSINCSLSLLGGLVSISLNTIGVGTYTGTLVTVEGNNTIDVRFNSTNGGTIGFGKRNLIGIKVQ